MDNACNFGYRLIDEIFKVKKEFQKTILALLEKNIPRNSIFLRLQSVFYGAILNDELKSLKYENLIYDIFKKEEQIYNTKNLISSYSLYSANSIYLTASLMKHSRGKIINEITEKIGNFFGYSKTESNHLTDIENMLPNRLGKVHNNFIKKFIDVGSTPLIQKQRFIYL